MVIKEATIHQLSKVPQSKGSGSVTRHLRPSVLPINDTLRTVSEELLAMYAQRANSTGTFGINPTLYQFPVHLAEYYAGRLGFYEFTLEAISLIQAEMEESLLASGGFALFLRYEHAGNDHLMVAMLKLKAGAGINESTLDLEPTLNIDVSLLHEAARINLTRFAAEEEPYLTFIRGKARAGVVTEYFRNALSCTNFTSAKLHTEQVIQAATDFVEAREDLATSEEKLKELVVMKARLYDCFASNKKEVVLATLAAAIMPEDPENFLDFVREAALADKYHLAHQFQPDKKSFEKLKRIQGRIGKTILLSFSVDDVQQSRVSYDPNNNMILIGNPTGDLIKAINDNVLPP